MKAHLKIHMSLISTKCWHKIVINNTLKWKEALLFAQTVQRNRKYPESGKSDVVQNHLSPLQLLKYFTSNNFSSGSKDVLINYNLAVDKLYHNFNIVLPFLLAVLFNVHKYKISLHMKKITPHISFLYRYIQAMKDKAKNDS